MSEATQTPPAASSTPPASGGTSSLLDQMDTLLGPGAEAAGGEGGEPGGGTPPTPPAGGQEPPKPAAATPPTGQQPPKPAAGQQPPKSRQEPPKAAQKPAAKPPVVDPKTEKDPVALRKRLQEVETELNNVRGSAASQQAQLQAKLDELSKKRYWTPEDEQRFNAIQTRQQQLEANYYALNYAESPEFKDKFEKPWQKKHTEIIEDIKGMTIKVKGADGEDTTRAATPADWFSVLNAPTAAAARQIAKATFGEEAADVLAYRQVLKTMEQAGKDAIEAKRTGFDGERKTMMEAAQKNMMAFTQQRDGFSQALVQKYPQFFGEEGATDEEKAALKQGMDFVQQSLQQAAALPPEEYAKRAAAMGLYASAFPRMVIQNKALRAQITDLEAKLAKFQKSDPGAAGEGGGSAEPGSSDGGLTGTDKLIAGLKIAKEE